LQLQEKAPEAQSRIVTLPADLQADMNRLRENKQEIKAERQKLLQLKQEKNRQELYEILLHCSE
jgi:hypothetical protein